MQENNQANLNYYKSFTHNIHYLLRYEQTILYLSTEKVEKLTIALLMDCLW